ncbi:MAG: type II toxin-antitoxin system HicA family toxin [Shinella sp.]|nr:type II toxin-antitoxin system HicA family toxin [Shinella sp.]
MSKRYEQMRRNPLADWRIEDVEAVCREFGIRCEASRSGSSHYKILHASQREILTIPYKRPIKPVYIKRLVAFIDAVAGLEK